MRPLALLLLLAPAALGQDLYRRAPLLCDKVPDHERESALDATIPEIQMNVQPGPPPTQSTEMCMNTTTTAGSAGHTFPSAYAGRYVTLRSVIVTASGLKKTDIDGRYWFAVQLGGGDEYAGLEVSSEIKELFQYISRYSAPTPLATVAVAATHPSSVVAAPIAATALSAT